MKRDVIFARIDGNGNGVPLPHCTGSCHGGRARCNCPTGQTELACDVGHDFYRQIKPPVRKPEPNWRARAAGVAVAWAAAGSAGMAALLALFGASCFRR